MKSKNSWLAIGLSCFCLIFSFANALPIARDSLDCGLVVLTYQTHHLPMIEMRWVCYAGSAYDPMDKAGLANLTAKMLTRGTKMRTATEISSQLELVGASISDATGYDLSSLHARCLSKDFDLVLDIFTDILQNADFKESELAKVKNQIIANIKQSYDYPHQVGWQKFYELLFKEHPYAHPISGDTVSVSRIRRQDLVDFYNQFYTLNNGFFVVVGDFDKAVLLEKLQTKFVNMRKGKVQGEISEFLRTAYAERPVGYLIQQPTLNQSYIYIGFGGIKENAPDYFAVRVMNFILGGSPLTSRLGNAVRETGGLAYDVRSGFYRMRYGGAFVATTQTSDPQRAIRYILDEIKKMYEIGAKQEELNRAKTFYIGNFPFYYDAMRDKVDLLAELEVYKKGLDYPERFKSYIEELTLDQINQAAKKYLYPNNYLLVIVTNLSKDELGLSDIDWLN